jgi:hypothetical protein
MTARSQHVVPSNGKWSVRSAGASRASQTFLTQGEAIEAARRIAREQQTTLYVHSVNGRIRDRQSFAADVRPLKG